MRPAPDRELVEALTVALQMPEDQGAGAPWLEVLIEWRERQRRRDKRAQRPPVVPRGLYERGATWPIRA